MTRLRFGRHPDNDVSFDAHRDLDASSRHAELRRKGRGYVLHDVGSSNGTFTEGRRVAELPLEKAAATEVEFGAGGPRIRIWIGGLDEEPPPPRADATRGLGEMVRQAARDGRTRGGGFAGAVAFGRSLFGQLARRSSWRLRVGLLMVVVALLIGLAGLLGWRAAQRERAERWQKPAVSLGVAGECAKLPGVLIHEFLPISRSPVARWSALQLLGGGPTFRRRCALPARASGSRTAQEPVHKDTGSRSMLTGRSKARRAG